MKYADRLRFFGLSVTLLSVTISVFTNGNYEFSKKSPSFLASEARL